MLFFCITLTCIYAQNDAYHDALLNQLEADYELTGGTWVLTPDEAANATNATAYGHGTTQNAITGEDFSLAVNLDIAGAGMNPWDAGYFNENVNTVQAGERVLVVVWLRTVSAAFAAPGRLDMYVERPVTYDKEIFITMNPTPQWQQYLIPFEASGEFVPGQMRVGFHLAFQEQVIEFGGLAMINYGTSICRKSYTMTSIRVSNPMLLGVPPQPIESNNTAKPTSKSKSLMPTVIRFPMLS